MKRLGLRSGNLSGGLGSGMNGTESGMMRRWRSAGKKSNGTGARYRGASPRSLSPGR